LQRYKIFLIKDKIIFCFGKYIFFVGELNEAVSKACHPALDAGSPEKTILIIRGLRVDPESSSGRNDIIVRKTFETAPFCDIELNKKFCRKI